MFALIHRVPVDVVTSDCGPVLGVFTDDGHAARGIARGDRIF